MTRAGAATKSKVIKIDASKRDARRSIDKAVGELKLDRKEKEGGGKETTKKSKGEDLLEMMDSADSAKGGSRSSTRSSGSRPKSAAKSGSRSDSKGRSHKH